MAISHPSVIVKCSMGGPPEAISAAWPHICVCTLCYTYFALGGPAPLLTSQDIDIRALDYLRVDLRYWITMVFEVYDWRRTSLG